MAAPDYSELFASAQLSDLSIALLEEHLEQLEDLEDTDKAAGSTDDAEPASKRRRTRASSAAPEERSPEAGSPGSSRKLLPGHSIVLFGCSTFCKTKLQNWSSDGTAGKLEICITVPAGQLAVGELLVQCMYAAQPDVLVTTCSQEQLLQLLLLADRYGVPKVLQAVTAAFANTVPADLQWETLQALYTLPPACADMEACKAVFELAGDKLHLELGDLELVWQDAEKEELFLALPQRALQQLLQDPRTRVASENTAFYSLEGWWLQQEAPDLLDVRGLLQLVRLQHCTGLYVATVVARSSLATNFFTPAELAEACILAAAAPRLAQALLDRSSVAANMPAWKAAKRPASAMLQLDLQWQLPLQQLRSALEKHIQDTAEQPAMFSSQYIWRGSCFVLMMKVRTHSDAAEPSTDFGLFLGMPDLEAGAVCMVSFEISIAAAGARTSPNGHRQVGEAKRDIVLGRKTLVLEGGSSRGKGSMLKFGVLSSWQQAEVKLRELGLVHSDDCLHIRGLVTDVV